MSKEKFAPGKRVLLLRENPQEPRVEHLVGTTQVLGVLDAGLSADFGEPLWKLVGVRVGFQGVSWTQCCMILLDPDETPEQSAEAMRRLHDTTAPVKTQQLEEILK